MMYTLVACIALFIMIMVAMVSLIGVILFVYNSKIDKRIDRNMMAGDTLMTYLNDQLGIGWLDRYSIICHNITGSTPYTKIKFEQTVEWFNSCHHLKLIDCDVGALLVELSDTLKYGTELNINLLHSILYDIIDSNKTNMRKMMS